MTSGDDDGSGSTGVGWWAYCIVRSAGRRLPLIEAVEPGTCVEMVREGDLAALISPVPLDDYGDVPLREHMKEFHWVERAGRAHDAVLEQVLENEPLIPLRLCTIYRDHAALRRLLRNERSALRRSLSAVQGRAEWELRMFVEPGTTTHRDSGFTQEPVDPGYLAAPARDTERRVRRRPGAWAELLAEMIHARLQSFAVRVRTNRPQPPEAHGRAAEMLLDAAYLVDRDREDELREAVRELSSSRERSAVQLELTGPWPAYHFIADSAAVVP